MKLKHAFYAGVIALLFGFAGAANAATGSGFELFHADQKEQRPRGIMGSVYTSSFTCAASPSVVVSSYPAILHTISISSAGLGSPVLEVFNGSFSTSTTVEGMEPRRFANFDGTSKMSYPFDVFMSSGIVANNKGTTPACVNYAYTMLMFQ